MPFMVIYRTSDGSSGYEQADAIDEAALFVERLRNSEGIDQVRIYRMEEISFAFRPYYKVELGMPDRQSAPPPKAEPRMAPVEIDPEPDRTTVEESGPEPEPERASVSTEVTLPPPPRNDDDATAANGRRGLFGR